MGIKGSYSQSYGFSSSHVQMWELDQKKSWVPRNWCFWTVMLEKILESPLDCKKIKPINPKGNQPWIFIGRIDAKAEAPILWPPDVKSWLIRKDPDAGKDWRWEEKGMTEDQMVGWHHRLDGHEFEQALGVGDGQGSLACCSPWGHKELDMTEWLIWTELDCSPPSSSSHGILQARILEWVAMPSSRGSSWSRDWTLVSCGSCIAGRFFTTEPPGKPYLLTGSTQIKEGLVFKLHHLSLLSKIIC